MGRYSRCNLRLACSYVSERFLKRGHFHQPELHHAGLEQEGLTFAVARGCYCLREGGVWGARLSVRPGSHGGGDGGGVGSGVVVVLMGILVEGRRGEGGGDGVAGIVVVVVVFEGRK